MRNEKPRQLINDSDFEALLSRMPQHVHEALLAARERGRLGPPFRSGFGAVGNSAPAPLPPVNPEDYRDVARAMALVRKAKGGQGFS